MKTVQGVMLHFDGQRKIHQSISDAHGVYHAYRLVPDVFLAMYLEEFTALVETIEHYGGCIGHDTALIDHETTVTTLEAKKKGAHDKLLAMDFLKKAPWGRFGGLLTDLDNLFREEPTNIRRTWWRHMPCWSTTSPHATPYPSHPQRKQMKTRKAREEEVICLLLN